jgi:hypothetical protein
MKRSDLIKLIKEELKEIKVEPPRRYNTAQELIPVVDEYLSNFYVKTTTAWAAKLKEIYNSEEDVANKLNFLADEVQKELKILNNFDREVRFFINKYDEAYQQNPEAEDENEIIYDELDSLHDKLNYFDSLTEDYTEKLNNLADTYRDMYDSWRYLVKYNWK